MISVTLKGYSARIPKEKNPHYQEPEDSGESVILTFQPCFVTVVFFLITRWSDRNLHHYAWLVSCWPSLHRSPVTKPREVLFRRPFFLEPRHPWCIIPAKVGENYPATLDLSSEGGYCPMGCSKCRFENAEAAKFCSESGAKIESNVPRSWQGQFPW